MKLQESLKELIYEIAAIDSVMNSIKYKQIVIINYEGDENFAMLQNKIKQFA